MAWRPVVVTDYADFVEGGGPEPEDWRRQLRHKNRPVVGVSWREARAFCAWATTAWPVPAGWEVALPTETEWERAARGLERHVYPWGDPVLGEAPVGDGDAARANFGGLGVRRFTPVGALPAGCRGRLADLAGNVWEWCKDAWRADDDPSWGQHDVDSPQRGDDCGAPRVVRGGSWLYHAGSLRCAYRFKLEPEGRYEDIGFRLVCRPVREHLVR